MSQEDKKNELLIGTSIKEEMTIHGNYLKKLSDGINKVNNRINNLNKETLILIKKDLKSESNSILEDFKSGLKDSINRIEAQLREKVDNNYQKELNYKSKYSCLSLDCTSDGSNNLVLTGEDILCEQNTDNNNQQLEKDKNEENNNDNSFEE